MMPRQAVVLIADEIYFNLHGKAILQGIYPNDLVIPTDPTTINQLLFYFIIETEIKNPFRSLSVEVQLPGAEPLRNPILVPPAQLFETLIKTQPERTVFGVKHPMLIGTPVLRPGRIISKVIHEDGEILLTPNWITLNPVAPTTKTN